MQYLVQFIHDHPETAAPVHTEPRKPRTPIQQAMQPKQKPEHKQIFAPSIHDAETVFAQQNPSLTVLQVSRISAGKGKILDDTYTATKTNRIADEPADRTAS